MNRIRRIWRSSYLKKFINRNNKILNSSIRYTQKGIVNLHWWSIQKEENKENVGDFLSTIIYKEMLKLQEIDEKQQVGKTVHLYAIGSILQGGAQSATIWGSGLKNGIVDLPLAMRITRKLDVRAVRGPETRNALLAAGYDCPEVYGDPAILMPMFYCPKSKKKEKEPLVILHMDSRLSYKGSITPIVDVDKYEEFICKICDASVVVSSSLHGIILAETYGVPAILLKDKESDNLFKYDDYYHSTGRVDYPIAESIEEALNMAIPKVPDLSDMRQSLITVFPYDLWNETKKEK